MVKYNINLVVKFRRRDMGSQQTYKCGRQISVHSLEELKAANATKCKFQGKTLNNSDIASNRHLTLSIVWFQILTVQPTSRVQNTR